MILPQRLTELNATSDGITSLTGVQNLTGLTSLDLHTNSISDISALSGLTSLMDLWLDHNPNLTDIQPLLDNTGLGAGDWVHLRAPSVTRRSGFLCSRWWQQLSR